MYAIKSITKLCETVVLAMVTRVISELSAGKPDNDLGLDVPEDKHIKELLEYLDGMAYDVQAIHNQLHEQDKKLRLLEEKINYADNGVEVVPNNGTIKIHCPAK